MHPPFCRNVIFVIWIFPAYQRKTCKAIERLRERDIHRLGGRVIQRLSGRAIQWLRERAIQISRGKLYWTRRRKIKRRNEYTAKSIFGHNDTVDGVGLFFLRAAVGGLVRGQPVCGTFGWGDFCAWIWRMAGR